MKMGEEKSRKKPGDALLEWYDSHRRDLPWREDPTPYHIWISEIMLQQTRVETVRGYYARFLERFPDVRSLAEAEEDECLKLWEGLGYYSRARNLKKAAGQIMSLYGGEMPRRAAELRKLSGIGPYTSAAIASIAYGEKIPAVDGNLLRVFSRLALYEQEIRTPAASASAHRFFLEIMPDDRPGDFNQALMDLGSGVCVPGTGAACQADPAACPLSPFCRAYHENRAASLPVMPAGKKRRVDQRTILVIRDGDRVLLRRRPPRGLLAGLYEFPNEEGWLTAPEAVEKARSLGCEPVRISPLEESRHIFTHREWHMQAYEIWTGSFPENEHSNSNGESNGESVQERGSSKNNVGSFPENEHSTNNAAGFPEKESLKNSAGSSPVDTDPANHAGETDLSLPGSGENHLPADRAGKKKRQVRAASEGSGGKPFFVSVSRLQERYAVPSAYAAYLSRLVQSSQRENGK